MNCIPYVAILLPATILFSILKPDSKEPNSVIYLAHAGAVILAFGLLTYKHWINQKLFS
ncbi:hypothetical protein BH23BAC2_BH23BAC2_00100 [soil metagenome]